MTLLAPIAGAIAAAIAVPLVVALYLLKLRRRPARVSSTLLWEQAVRDLEVNVPFRRLRMSVAFVLHLLAAAALALAIGRPAWDSLSAARGRVLIVIDRSASMGAVDGEGVRGPTRLDDAKARAAELVARLTGTGVSASPEVTIAQFAASGEVMTAPTRNRATLLEAVKGVTQTDQPGDQEALARLLSAFASPSEDAATETTAYVVSDGGPMANETRRVLSGVGVEFVRVGENGKEKGPRNLGITAIDARRDTEDPASVRLFVRVVGTGSGTGNPLRHSESLVTPPPLGAGEGGGEAVVRVLIDGEAAGVMTVPLTPTDEAGVASRAGLVEATATSLLPVPRGAILTAMLPGNDALAADDSASVVLAAPTRPRVVVVSPQTSNATPESAADGFLRAVLRGLDLGWVRYVDPASAWGLINAGEASPDVVIFDRVRPAALTRVPSVSLGAGLPIAGLTFEPASTGANATTSASTRVLSWRRQHPVLRHVPLDTVIVEAPGRLTFESGPQTPASPFVPLAEGTGGPLMALLDDGGVPRLVVGFAQADANWGPSAAFPVFLSNAIDFLTLRNQSAGGRWGRTTTFTAMEGSVEAREVRVRGPIERTVLRAATATVSPTTPTTPTTPSGAWTADVGVLPRAGLYRVEGMAGGAGAGALAINLCDAGESSLVTREVLLITGEGASAADGPVPPSPGELWPWLVLAALLALTVEWMWSAWRMRM